MDKEAKPAEYKREIDRKRLKKLILIWVWAITVVFGILASYNLFFFAKLYSGFKYWDAKWTAYYNKGEDVPCIDPYGEGDEIIRREIFSHDPSYAVSCGLRNHYRDRYWRYRDHLYIFGTIALFPWILYFGWILIRWHYRFLYPNEDGHQKEAIDQARPLNDNGHEILNEPIGTVSTSMSPSSPAKTGTVPQSQAVSVTEDDYRTFVGKNADKYLRRFRKFSISGSDSFAATWHWSACLFGPLWMFYRKLYTWGFLTGLISLSLSVLLKMAAGDTPWKILFEAINALTAILCGLFGYYLYFRLAKKRILRAKLEAASNNVPYTLSHIGGVQTWVLTVLIIIFVAGIVLAIALPAYRDYRKKAETTRNMQSTPHQANATVTQGSTESVVARKIDLSGLPDQVESVKTTYNTMTDEQIRQIEEIAQAIAAQHNANAEAQLDEITVSTHAVAIKRNVRLENVLRVKKGLVPAKLKEFADETKREILAKVCKVNANNPAFGRGLSFTFVYLSTYGEKLAEFDVDEATCKN